jgi:outer membrane autotransporter protein
MTVSGVGAYEGSTVIEEGALIVTNSQALSRTGSVNVFSQAAFNVQASPTIGSLEGDGSTVVAADQTLTFGAANNDSSFEGTFSGAGSVVKMGTGTFTFNGSSSLTKPILISGGTWVMGNGGGSVASAGGPVTVNAGGRLSGSGTLGELTVASGGAVAPGNSVGTLNVTGNATLAPGSTYIVEIGPNGTSDLISATGTVTLGGELRLNELDPFELGQRYTIVSAEQGVRERFSNPDLSLPLLNLPIIYNVDNQHVYLDAVRNDTPMSDFGGTENEKNTADAIDSLDPNNPLKVAILNLSDRAEIKEALGQASGDIHASAKSAFVQDSHFLRDATLGRLRQSFTPGGGPGTPVVTYSEDGQSHWAPANTGDKVFWTQVFGATGQAKNDGNAAKLNQSTMGAFFGTDARVGEDWRVGGLFGYSTMTLDVHSHHSSARSDGFHLGAYGGRQWDAWGLRTGFGYSWYDMRIKRSVDFKGYSDSLKNRTNVSTTQLFGELGYQIDQGRFLLEPYFNAAMVYVSTGKLNESGGAAALHEESARKMKTAFTTFGLHGSTHFRLNKLDGLVQATLGWRHAYGSVMPESTHAFAESENYKVVEGVPIDKNAAVLELGVD